MVHSYDIVKGLGSGWMPCPYVRVPVHAKGETVELRALIMPRSIVGRDVLLGRDTPGLEYNWQISPEHKRSNSKSRLSSGKP